MLQNEVVKSKCPYCLSTKHFKTCMQGLEFIIQHTYIKWSEVEGQEPFIEEIDKEMYNSLYKELFISKLEKGNTIYYTIPLTNCDPMLHREAMQEAYGNCHYCGGDNNIPYWWELQLIDDPKIYWIWIWYCKDCFTLELDVSLR